MAKKEMSQAEERQMQAVLKQIPGMSDRVLEGQWKSVKASEQPKWYRDALKAEIKAREARHDEKDKKQANAAAKADADLNEGEQGATQS